MSSNRLFARVLAGLLATLSLAGCMSYEPPLRIALTRWPPYEYLHLAREKGFFEQEGVEVRLIEFVAVTDTQRALEHDKIDGGTLSLMEVLQNRALRTRELQIPMVVDFSDGADVVLATPAVADVSALRGRKVGVTNGALDLYILTRALEQHGLTLKDVELVHMRHEEMLNALRSGKVDAVTAFPPTSSGILQAGIARPIFSSHEIPGEIVDVLAIDKKVLRKRPDDVARMIRAFYRALDYARQHPDEAMQIMAARERADVATFRNSLHDGITIVSLAEQQRFLADGSRLEGVAQRISQLLHEHGHVSSVDDGHELLNAHAVALAAAR